MTSTSLSFPDTRNTFHVVHEPAVSSDTASALLNPTAHLTSSPSKERITYTPIPEVMFRQTLPTPADFKRWQSVLGTDKKFCPEFTPEPAYRPFFHKISKPPRRAAPTNLNASLPDMRAQPTRQLQQMSSYFHINPSEHLPPTRSGPWQKIDPVTDSELGNYVVSSSHAFKTQWLKHQSLKHRKFDPSSHPEFEQLTAEHHRHRDRETLHREAMLRVKAMLSKS